MTTDNPFLLPLTLSAVVSPLLRRLLYAGALGAGVAIWISAISVPVKIVASLLLVLYMRVILHRIRSNQPNDPKQITLLHDDSWQVTTQIGETLPAKQNGASFIHAKLIVLSLRYNRHKKVILLTPDCQDPTRLRRLRVRLQHAGGRDSGKPEGFRQ